MKAVNSWGSSAAGFNLGDALVEAAKPPVFSTRAIAVSPTRKDAITSAGRVFTSPLAWPISGADFAFVRLLPRE